MPLLLIDDSHRVVAATLVQWLGSNVGMGFLRAALRRCGYSIVRDKHPVE